MKTVYPALLAAAVLLPASAEAVQSTLLEAEDFTFDSSSYANIYQQVSSGQDIPGGRFVVHAPSLTDDAFFYHIAGSSVSLSGSTGIDIQSELPVSATVINLEDAELNAGHLSISITDSTLGEAGGLYGIYAFASSFGAESLAITQNGGNSESAAIVFDASDNTLSCPIKIEAYDAGSNLAGAFVLFDSRISISSAAQIIGNIHGDSASELILDLKAGSSFYGDIDDSLNAEITLNGGASWSPRTGTRPHGSFSAVLKEGSTLDLSRTPSSVYLENVHMENGARLHFSLTDAVSGNEPLLNIVSTPASGQKSLVIVSVDDRRENKEPARKLFFDANESIEAQGESVIRENELHVYREDTRLSYSAADQSYEYLGRSITNIARSSLVNAYSDTLAGQAFVTESAITRPLLGAQEFTGSEDFFWAKAFYGKDRLKSEDRLRKQTIKSAAVMAGFSVPFGEYAAGAVLYAGSADHTMKTADADTDIVSATLFAKKTGPEREMVLAATYAHAASTLKTSGSRTVAPGSTRYRFKQKTDALGVSFMMGHFYHFGEAVLIEPYWSVSHYELKKGSTGWNSGVRFEAEKARNSLARLGVKGSYSFSQAPLELTADISWGKRWEHDRSFTGKTTSESASFETDTLPESSFDLKLGARYDSAGTRFYADFGAARNKHSGNLYEIFLGFRHKF